MPPAAASKAPARRVVGAGEGAALVAEELVLEQVRRQRGAVDDDERPVAARARLVDRLGGEILAGAGLALQEHGGVAGGGALEQREGGAHRRPSGRAGGRSARAATAGSRRRAGRCRSAGACGRASSVAPWRSGASRTGTPSTKVPLVLPRSRTSGVPSAMRISQWNLDIAGSAISTSADGCAPMTVRSPPRACTAPSPPSTTVRRHSRTRARVGSARGQPFGGARVVGGVAHVSRASRRRRASGRGARRGGAGATARRRARRRRVARAESAAAGDGAGVAVGAVGGVGAVGAAAAPPRSTGAAGGASCTRRRSSRHATSAASAIATPAAAARVNQRRRRRRRRGRRRRHQRGRQRRRRPLERRASRRRRAAARRSRASSPAAAPARACRHCRMSVSSPTDIGARSPGRGAGSTSCGQRPPAKPLNGSVPVAASKSVTPSAHTSTDGAAAPSVSCSGAM